MRPIALAIAAALVSVVAPAFADDAMSSHDKMTSCHAMSHDAMMKDADCVKLAKGHDGMMKHDSMMKHDGMMKSGQ